MTAEYEDEDGKMVPPDPIVERYLFQIWPAALEDLQVLRMTSEIGSRQARRPPSPRPDLSAEVAPPQQSGGTTIHVAGARLLADVLARRKREEEWGFGGMPQQGGPPDPDDGGRAVRCAAISARLRA